MSKLKMWVVSILAVLILGGGGWTAYQAIAQKNSLNHAYAYAYKTKDRMNWFELSENKGKVTGHLNEKYVEEVWWDPKIYRKQYVVSGSSKENGYELRVKQGKETIIYEVQISGEDLSVKKQGDKKSIIYKAINQKKLDSYHKKIQDRYEYLFDTSETRFYDNMRHFKEKVSKVYGFLYTAEDKQLFLQVKSMHIEIGWNGSFLITTVSEEVCKPYKEMKLEVGGFTDGGEFFEMSYDPIIEKGVIIGSTDRDAKSIKLPVKMTDGKVELKAFTRKEYKKIAKPYIMTGDSVELKAVTKEEYKKQAKAFKKKAEEKKK
ncbi:hypothetical protein ABD83_07395 [Bacillus xiamenensis]|uniref:Uncharacterized protein n=1 Tax=Bacillus xiamenensis TaxID=1178537 RepID=A0ABT4EX04_9BACI|nr:hypothetical protein [Bacillus xiamenensis]MBG9911280.1 hypothetical protein [Bacillus xiamenensis]MCY9574245.1 hypothetical protein [Bacillus xiamenensis]